MGVLSIGAAQAPAQDFAIDGFSLDGGGLTSSAGGAFELGCTSGQPDAGVPMTGGNFELTGGFWPGAQQTGGGDCTGNEKIKQAKCKQKQGSNTLTVKLSGGVANDSFSVDLSSVEHKDGNLNLKGKGKARFTDVPAGPGTVTTTWGCGVEKQTNYSCP